jgi:transposase
LKLYEFTSSMRLTSKILQISHASICRWSKRPDPLVRREAAHSKITSAIEASMKLRLSERPNTSASQLCRMIRDDYGEVVSRQLVHVVLRKRLNFSWKRTRKRGPRGVDWTDERVSEFKKSFMAAYQAGRLASLNDHNNFRSPL